MKEKIEQYTQGKFEFHTPQLYVSEEYIEVDVEAGRDYVGNVTVKNADETAMKGLVYSSSPRISLGETSFAGTENVLSYEIKCNGLLPGETLQGQIEIVSSSGEITIPVTVRMVAPFCTTSMGVVKDLFQFTNLAKEDWDQALELFVSNEFERVFLHQDAKSLLLYECVLPSTDPNVALEEFLIGVHKKVPVVLSLKQNRYEYELDNRESFSEKVVLRKESWGYVDIRIVSDSPFVTVEMERITNENFIGNTYELEYIVHPDRMRAGRNFARIELSSGRESHSIEISCLSQIDTRGKRKKREFLKARELDLMTAYLDYRTEVISASQYVMETERIVRQMLAKEPCIRYEMLLTHILIIGERIEEAGAYLDSFRPLTEEWKRESLFEYSAYEYLRALQSKDSERIEQSKKVIQDLYENGHENWKNLWFLLYLDKEYQENPSLKLARLRTQILAGVNSPFLYYEVVSVYNREPSLFCELDPFSIQVINYGIRADCISEEIASQFIYLASREKYFNPVIYRALTLLYDKYETNEVLTAICTLLIKGQKTGEKYFAWYHLGVLAQLKITQLAESYMYSLNEEDAITLPDEILLYFVYNSNLSDAKKAYLYAYVVRHKEEIPSLYRTYLKQMENFCIKQLGMQHVNRNLAILYESLLDQETVTPVLATNLPHIIFRYELRCEMPNIKGVCVVHKELYEEKYLPLNQTIAYVELYTENAQILLVDNEDNRYVSTEGYTLTRLMNPDRFTDICYACHIEDPMILLHLSEKMEKYQKMAANALDVREKVYRMPNLRPFFYKRCLLEIMKHYYDVMDNEKLEMYLADMNLHSLSRKEQSSLIEYAIIQGMTLRVYELLKEFGYELIPLKRLYKFCVNIQAEYDPFLLQLYYHVFRLGKYNETMIRYLNQYYNGLSKHMYEVWECGRDLKCAVDEIEERTLAQMLFAESFHGKTFLLFSSFYEKNADRTITKAFLAYYAYRYLVHDRIVPNEFFDVLLKELVMEESRLNRLALLKYLSRKPDLTQEEKHYVAVYIGKYTQQGFVLPFFQDFKGKIELPVYITDKYYVEYKADPANQVVIHYRLNDDVEFVSETMKNLYYGIFVKEFVLFYNDELQYYITEGTEGAKNVTESLKKKMDDSSSDEGDTKFNAINFMLMAKELRDDTTLTLAVENQIRTDYMMEQLFKIK